MENKKDIYSKLLEFQKKGISIVKGSQNPHFKNRYADMNEVLDKVIKPLNELGIVVVQSPEVYNYREASLVSGLRTRLHDTESDTYVESYTPFINPVDMQKLGGAITYARRYSLIAMLGLEDEDDDGNRASTSPTAHRAPQEEVDPFIN